MEEKVYGKPVKNIIKEDLVEIPKKIVSVVIEKWRLEQVKDYDKPVSNKIER